MARSFAEGARHLPCRCFAVYRGRGTLAKSGDAKDGSTDQHRPKPSPAAQRRHHASEQQSQRGVLAHTPQALAEAQDMRAIGHVRNSRFP